MFLSFRAHTFLLVTMLLDNLFLGLVYFFIVLFVRVGLGAGLVRGFRESLGAA